jgi:hypothetical protein
MTLYRKASNRVHALRLSLQALTSDCVDDAQRQAIADVAAAVDQLQRMLDASESLKRPTGASRSAFNFAGLIYAGDSFTVPAGRVASLRSAASAWAKLHGVKLTVNKLADGGARCTRLDGPQAPAGTDDDGGTF